MKALIVINNVRYIIDESSLITGDVVLYRGTVAECENALDFDAAGYIDLVQNAEIVK